MIEIPNKAAHIDIFEETIAPIGKLWSLSIESKHKLEFILEIKLQLVIFYYYLIKVSIVTNDAYDEFNSSSDSTTGYNIALILEHSTTVLVINVIRFSIMII